MKMVHPALLEPILIGTDRISCLVIENRSLFRNVILDIINVIEGRRTGFVLSNNQKELDISKSVEVISDFVSFDINKKSLLSKIISALEKEAVSAEKYVKTQELLSDIERMIDEWAFDLSCDIVPQKISVISLLKSVGIEVRNDYEGDAGEAEKILDYMELVRNFDRNKLFITINMRSFFDDAITELFQKSVLQHEFYVLMMESNSYEKTPYENRITIDNDLCEF